MLQRQTRLCEAESDSGERSDLRVPKRYLILNPCRRLDQTGIEIKVRHEWRIKTERRIQQPGSHNLSNDHQIGTNCVAAGRTEVPFGIGTRIKGHRSAR